MQKEASNRILTGVGVLFILLWCLLPVAWIISLSFKSQDAVTNGSPGFLPSDGSGAGWQNYKDVIQDDQFGRAIINSIGISLIATVLSVILATLAAYAIARLEFKGKKFVLTTALVIAMFPVVSLVGPLFDMWRTFRIYDTWLGLIIPYMSFTLPLAIWTLSAFFREIPWEMEQAAQVDGATSWQAFRKVIVPLGRARRLHRGDPDVLLRVERLRLRHLAHLDRACPSDPRRPVVLRRRRSVQPAGSLLAAAAVVATVPIVVLVLFFQRKIVAGLTAGAVKG